MIYIFVENNGFTKQIKYVFDTMFNILGTEYEYADTIENLSEAYKDNDVLICFVKRNADTGKLLKYKNVILIKDSERLFGDNYLKAASIPETVSRFSLIPGLDNIKDIVCLYNQSDEIYINCSPENKSIVTNLDFISSTFFMLTRYEEVLNVHCMKEEIYNRFPAGSSLAYRFEFLDRPIVNEYIELLWSWIDSFKLGCKRTGWPEGKAFAACLTHDVDMIEKYKSFKALIRPVGSMLLKYRKLKLAVINVLNYFMKKINHKWDPYWCFNHIMNLEKSMGFKSSFYFMSGGTSEFDNYYSVTDKRVIDLIGQIEKEGFEAGYHCSFNSFEDLSIMEEEKRKLDSIIKWKPYGCRQHYLRFKVPLTWEQQEQLGLLYDASLSFADCEGFRCGICMPFRPYDLLKDKRLDIWEIPLVVMDTSLQNPNYSGYSPEKALEKAIDLINKVKSFNGVFTLLWHNSSLDTSSIGWQSWDKVYYGLMEYLKKCNCYGTGGREIVKLFCERLQHE